MRQTASLYSSGTNARYGNNQASSCKPRSVSNARVPSQIYISHQSLSRKRITDRNRVGHSANNSNSCVDYRLPRFLLPHADRNHQSPALAAGLHVVGSVIAHGLRKTAALSTAVRSQKFNKDRGSVRIMTRLLHAHPPGAWPPSPGHAGYDTSPARPNANQIPARHLFHQVRPRRSAP